MALLQNENHTLPAISIANCENLQSGINENMVNDALLDYEPVQYSQFDADIRPLNTASELNFN